MTSSWRSPRFEVVAIDNLPEIQPGDDLARLISDRFSFQPGDILVMAQKIVSKSEGRLVALDSVTPSDTAIKLAAEAEKDPRLVQLILDESRRVVRVRPGLIIVEDRRGWICANAGIDRSNIVQTAPVLPAEDNDISGRLGGGDATVCLLPVDPDKSCVSIRASLQSLTGVDVGVIINDSHGRAWRDGTVGVAIGAAGVEVLADRRGRQDRHGYTLEHTEVGTADELAAAASLLMGQAAEGIPAVVIRGLDVLGGGTATELQRPAERDLFR